ncbi:methionine ABC transporter permease [Klebsiella pneumoniae]|uniref:Methionine ABC transporter permease n=1 Tax=Klebsiella pneumoniae TaxID=573 RepID=A0A377TQI6_KLEPN|nr:methionine ABC transporter permease [Klebsiella pneumoniae]
MAAVARRMGNAGNDFCLWLLRFCPRPAGGVLLYVTRPGQIVANAKLYRTLSALVNIFRSIPFIILLVWMIPLPA